MKREELVVGGQYTSAYLDNPNKWTVEVLMIGKTRVFYRVIGPDREDSRSTEGVLEAWKPAPKVKKVKKYVVLWKDGRVSTFNSKEDSFLVSDYTISGKSIEIEFEEGKFE